MQCSAPRPQIRSVQLMPTTSRSGNSFASVFSADAIVRVVERRHQHQPVGDVEVGVAGRAAAGRRSTSGRGIGSFTTFKPAARRIARFSARLVVRVGDRLRRSDHRLRLHEARQVVDVAVRVVAGDAVASARSPARRRGNRASARSISSRLSPGLRACTGLSRHSSVVSSSPSPLTSMLPPSSTMLRRERPGASAASPTKAGTVASVLPVVVLGPGVEPPVR